jgi:phage tail sheath protein FI
MANTYLYGAYGHLGETIAQSAVQAGTTPVYVGVAPINLVRSYKDINGVNAPVKLNNFVDAQRKLGISQDWEKFSLCEVMTAHFNNPVGNIGPIYVINVLDPEVHKASSQTTKSLTFVNGRAEFVSDLIILDTLAIADKAEGVDYNLDYNYTKNSVVISSIDADAPLSGSITVTYFEVDLSKITSADIIGGVTAGGEYSGLGALRLLYQEQNQVCNLLAAPGWSHEPAVYNALISAAQKINGHWDAFVCADIPLVAEDDEAVDTITKAVAWKKENGYTNERSKVCWPQTMDNAGQIFHLSTLAMVELMRADFAHASVPMETCGNKEIQGIKQYFGPDSKNRGFDQQDANDLTSNGIMTLIAWGGRWVLWGDHTAAYSYGADVDPRAIFDVSIRMLFHITNSFQREWSPKIDKPMTLQLKDRILNREQEKLDALVARGALIGDPKVLFLESENSTTDLMNGDFRWDIAATPTPPLKSATVYVAYTDAGFSAYFGNE